MPMNMHIRTVKRGGFWGVDSTTDAAYIKLYLAGSPSVSTAVEAIGQDIVLPPDGDIISLEWYAKVTDSTTPSNFNVYYYPIGFEEVTGFWNGITVQCIKRPGGTWHNIFLTRVGGKSYSTQLTLDPTVEHKYKIVWEEGISRLYIDDEMVAIHAAAPTVPMFPFMEIAKCDNVNGKYEMYAMKPWSSSNFISRA